MAKGPSRAALKSAEPAVTLTKAGRARKRDPERTSAAILAAAVRRIFAQGL